MLSTIVVSHVNDSILLSKSASDTLFATGMSAFGEAGGSLKEEEES